MNLNEYQIAAQKTAIYPPGLDYPILGLAGEAGEICNKYKKIIRDSGGVLSEEKEIELAKELGDVLWYVAQIASELDVSLYDVATSNLEKLSDRAERGVIGGSGDNR